MGKTLVATGFIALAMTAACGRENEGPLDTFVLEVHGTRASLERFQLSATGAEVAPGLVFSDGFLSRVLRSRLPWSELAAHSFDVRVTEGGTQVGALALKPYLCAAGAGLQRLTAGWRARETHQAFLTGDGQLEVDMDFDHPLHYSCEWWTADGRAGEGLSSLTHAEPRCADDARKGTSVRVIGNVGGVPVDVDLHTCEAVLTDKQQGEIFLTLIALSPAGSIVLSASHCLEGPNQAFPKELSLALPQRCPSGAAVSVAAMDSGPRMLEPVAGRWLIRKADFSKGGRLEGEIDVAVGDGTMNSLRIAGPVDLPFLRVPIEFDWPK
jgi:hypothetical protein